MNRLLQKMSRKGLASNFSPIIQQFSCPERKQSTSFKTQQDLKLLESCLRRKSIAGIADDFAALARFLYILILAFVFTKHAAMIQTNFVNSNLKRRFYLHMVLQPSNESDWRKYFQKLTERCVQLPLHLCGNSHLANYATLLVYSCKEKSLKFVVDEFYSIFGYTVRDI